MVEQEDKWRAEEDSRTLTRAIEIKRDKKRPEKAMEILREQAEAAKEAVIDADEAAEDEEE